MKHTTPYLKTSHADRINIIYLNQVHRMLPPDVAREQGLPINSVRNFIGAYLKHGRTNRKSGQIRNTVKKGTQLKGAGEKAFQAINGEGKSESSTDESYSKRSLIIRINFESSSNDAIEIGNRTRADSGV